ncbi:hypothetical protein Q0812_09560 [Brevundimonas sp. 2R-24]|uniref:AMIN domain-containing protein n=1 Tax=Peiella sedimenti TaxID=3061083 RepID=A0ABT8SQJ7_9CAUL|nr:hypothetical protein [Caulobacteraceae bacterium XZ-24]
MRALAIGSALVLALSSAAHADIRISIRANVAVQCGVAGVQASGSQLMIQTFCNTPNFSVVLTGPDGQPMIVSAQSAQAQVGVGAGQLNVQLQQPGFQNIAVTLEEPADASLVAVDLIPG